MNGGIGFLGLLTIIFIVLKLTKFIAWSWFLVLLPLYTPIVLLTLGYALIRLYMVIVDYKRNNK